MKRLALACLLLTLSAPASAQQRIIHDTLGRDMPTQITCGFCAGEQFGVVFRELPAGRRGLVPTDFPLTIDAVEVGLAAATVMGSSCMAQRSGGTVMTTMAIYVGDTPPTGSILALPQAGEWPGETLVWASDAVPVTLSLENDMGQFELNFNRLEILDDMDMPVRVESGTYLRVVFELPAGAAGTSDICADPLEPAGGYPVRDNDGTIAPERSFIYAAGAGWYWNEAVPGGGIGGDWGLRLSVFPSGVGPMTDGGAPMVDAGTPSDDAGAADPDGGPTDTDAGPGTEPPSEGCSCRATAASGPSSAWLVIGLFGVLWRARKRAARRTDGGTCE
ncbi:MAG: MYXO-CTERM sorting domain-containing protein [Sandaracinaceae bacterium]